METKNCQNCRKDFVVEPDDFVFYSKIDVPTPTFCEECKISTKRVYSKNFTSIIYCEFCYQQEVM